ncbi:hypothetical protein ACFVUS_16835 [Nocardia sp. NPDC058058]|uniref:hypothetical protein n=1 Tax=Nocardia sp. NPDC058058 TaxID=3346317 RepID=UPI0036DE3B15
MAEIGGHLDGPVGSAIRLNDESTGDYYIVDVHPETGSWGRVFALSTDFADMGPCYMAESMIAWWCALARDIEKVITTAEADGLELGEHFPVFDEEDEFSTSWCSWSDDIPRAFAHELGHLANILAPEATALADLPAETPTIDLDTITPPAMLDLDDQGSFERRANGRFAVSVPKSH